MRILSWNLWWRHGPWGRRREKVAATVAEIGLRRSAISDNGASLPVRAYDLHNACLFT
jgi:hypothetical protein